MADNFGIVISQPGVSTSNAKNSQMVFNTQNPFFKIDTQNPNGFITITLLITTDPPEPSGSVHNTYTTVYKFKHGYSYIPSIETLFYMKTPPPGAANPKTYFMDQGLLLAQFSGDDSATIYAAADATFVYYIIRKFNDGSGGANLLTGTNLIITTHVFVEDIGI